MSTKRPLGGYIPQTKMTPTEKPRIREYRVINSNRDFLETILNVQSKEGFTLDQIIAGQYFDVLIFSRPIEIKETLI